MTHRKDKTPEAAAASILTHPISRRRTLELGLTAAAGLAGLPAFSTQALAADAQLPEVLYSKEVTAEKLIAVYDRLSGGLSGRIGIKIHGGEAEVNLPLFEALAAHIPGSHFVETNWASGFGGSRGSTATHLEVIRRQGVKAPIDILDRDRRYTTIPIQGGAHLKEIEVCSAMLEEYGGIVVLTNFKIPSFAGYTGSVKNIGIGLVSPDGKAVVHEPGYQRTEAFFTNLADAAKGVKDYMGEKMIAINLLTRMEAKPFGGAEPKSGDLGIVASLDPVAADQAACDLIWGLSQEAANALTLQEKIDSGYLQLEKLGNIRAGSRRYRLAEV